MHSKGSRGAAASRPIFWVGGKCACTAAVILVGNSLDFGQERVVCSQRVATVPCSGKKCSAENRSPKPDTAHSDILFPSLWSYWFCYRSLTNGKLYVNTGFCHWPMWKWLRSFSALPSCCCWVAPYKVVKLKLPLMWSIRSPIKSPPSMLCIGLPFWVTIDRTERETLTAAWSALFSAAAAALALLAPGVASNRAKSAKIPSSALKIQGLLGLNSWMKLVLELTLEIDVWIYAVLFMAVMWPSTKKRFNPAKVS